MDKRRILLLSDQPLLAEALESLLGDLEDIEIVATWTLNEAAVNRIAAASPDALIVAGSEREARDAGYLMTLILDRFPDLPIFRVGLEDQVIRTYTSHTLASQRANLMDALRSLPVRRAGCGADEQSGSSGE